MKEYRFGRLSIALGSRLACGAYITSGCIWQSKVAILLMPFIQLYCRMGSHDFNSPDKMWGFYFAENYLVLGFDKFRKHWSIPFISWEYESNELLDYNFNRIAIKDKSTKLGMGCHNWYNGISFDETKKLEASVSKEFDYQYKLKRGEVQKRKASVFVTRMTHHRKWLPFLKRVVTSISVNFNDEVGERSGSWKGGVLGCGYDLLPNETPEQCLRRMESERVFN